jgi:murein DD-endopeptidase MepM/ murein hydrolase activator NlpD
MNPLLLFKATKSQLLIIFSTLAVIILLPVIAVFTIAGAGVQAVSSALAFINPITHLVEVHDPDGKLIAQISATTTWPTAGLVTTEFGDPTPYQKHHTGLDIAGSQSDPITPFMDGKIITVQNNPNNATGFGRYVTVDHGNAITSIYAHLVETSAVLGQDVKPGDVIGYEGATGHAIGIHLHFEIRVYNVPVNPRVFLVGNPVRSN